MKQKGLCTIGINIILGLGFISTVQAAGDVNKGKVLYAVCAACHGEQGEGNPKLNAPRLTILPDWYLTRQLKNYQDGIRGTHTEDLYGLQMRPISMSVLGEENFVDLVAYIATLESPEPRTTIVGDTRLGKATYATCISCHGANGEGNPALNSPALEGQHDWYIARQLKNFQKGIRGTKPEDMYGMQMRPMAMTLANDAAIRNVTTYISTFKPTLTPEPSASSTLNDLATGAETQETIAAMEKQGKALYTVCIACHGINGEGNQALNAPRLAGLKEWYIARQLKNYKEGIRGTHAENIYGVQMRPMAMTLTEETDVVAVSAYVATLTGVSASATIQGDANAGKAAYASCVACHGVNGEGNQALNAPSLRGQHDWYLVRQLKNFKSGLRGTNPNDMYGMQMRPMSMILADDAVIQNVVTYINTLP